VARQVGAELVAELDDLGLRLAWPT
jgi:hypothetical protein